MKSLFFVFCTLAFVIQSNAQRQCTPSLVREADLSFAEMVLLGDRATFWPNNEKELSKMCGPYKGNDKVVRKYARECLSGLPQQVIGLVLKGTGKIFKTFCGKNFDRNVFQHSPCGNKQINYHHACMDLYVQDTKNALSLSEDNRIAGACCSYNKFEKCILDVLRKEPELCTNETIKFFKMIIKSIASDAIDSLCVEYINAPEKCVSINKQMKPTNTPGKSLLLPLGSLMKSLA